MSLFGFTAGSGGAGGSGTDWGGIVGGIGNAITGIYQAKAQTKQLNALRKLQVPHLPGAFPTSFWGGVPAAPAAGWNPWAVAGPALGALGGVLGLGPDMLPGGLEESGTGFFGPDLFRPTAQSARQRMIDAVHPGTGERVYWRPVGRPIMFTGDRALLLRTRKVLRKMNGPAGCGPVGRRAVRRRRCS